MFKCIIIDDEPIAIKVIKKHLSAFTQFQVVGECANAIEAMGILPQANVDLIFCDIQMPHISGVEFVKSLHSSPKIIFTTAYRDYAIEAFDLNIVDYLLKPISFERFAQAINKFLELSIAPENKSISVSGKDQMEKNYMLVKADKKHHKIELDSILYFESMGDYVIVHTNAKKIITKERISNIFEMIPRSGFLRIHRSFIVSLKSIKAIGSGFVELESIRLPIGRNYKANIDNYLNRGNQ